MVIELSVAARVLSDQAGRVLIEEHLDFVPDLQNTRIIEVCADKHREVLKLLLPILARGSRLRELEVPALQDVQ